MKVKRLWFCFFVSLLSLCLILSCQGYDRAIASPQIIKIGFAAPLTGDQAQLGLDTFNGVKLAIDQANQKGEILPGYRLEPYPLDDQHNPAQAVSVARKFASDPDVAAVIGHFNSSCTKPASAIYHESRMVQITPASTNPEISKQGFDTFFRIVATDDVQGPKGAQYAMNSLGIKTCFVIDDKTTYGKGLADEFHKKAASLGISMLGHEGITQGDKDFTPLLIKIKSLNPELIYFGGIYPEGALLLRQARDLDIKAIFMGGDGIASSTFVELATPAIAEGTYATMVGGDMYALTGAQEFIAAYEKQYGPIGQWSAYGYDATNIVIEAIRKAGTADRQTILDAMRQIKDFQGVTGITNFDEKGDNLNQFIGVFKVEGGKLKYIGPAS